MAAATAHRARCRSGGRIIGDNHKLLAVARGLVASSKRRSERHRAHVRWVWLPSPGRVALQRSCALQLLQFIDSTIELAMLPRRSDCSNRTRVAHTHDDLSRQPPPALARRADSLMDRGSGRPSKAPFITPRALHGSLRNPHFESGDLHARLSVSELKCKPDPVELAFTSFAT